MELRHIPIFIGLIGALTIAGGIGALLVWRFPILTTRRVINGFLVALMVVSVLDMHSTYRMIQAFGTSVEGSLIPFIILNIVGVWGMIFFRLTVMNVGLYFLLRNRPVALIGILLFYVFAITVNYSQLIKYSIPLF